MKKVYQTRISNVDGDCSRAVVASLFDLGLCDVPDFVREHHLKPMNVEVVKFFRASGFNMGYIKNSPGLVIDGCGVNGYFYAIVMSKTFEDTRHAVIIDSDLVIVHDPNPNGLCLGLCGDDILYILVTLHDNI